MQEGVAGRATHLFDLLHHCRGDGFLDQRGERAGRGRDDKRDDGRLSRTCAAAARSQAMQLAHGLNTRLVRRGRRRALREVLAAPKFEFERVCVRGHARAQPPLDLAR